MSWYAIVCPYVVGASSQPPRGPWRSAEAACSAFTRWGQHQVRTPGRTPRGLTRGNARVHAYRTRRAARAADITDANERSGCADFLGVVGGPLDA